MEMEHELIMKLPPGRRYIVTYDTEGASLYAIATVACQSVLSTQTVTSREPREPYKTPATRLREAWEQRHPELRQQRQLEHRLEDAANEVE